MAKFVNIAEQNGKKYFRGEYRTYNRAIAYGKMDLEKMRNAVLFVGNENNVKCITMRTYAVIDGVRKKSACHIMRQFIGEV